MSKNENKSNNLFLAGALSGIAEGIAVQPFDMVKTRHQLNPGLNASVTRTLIELYHEGGVSRYYRGMSAELCGMVPKSSGMYATYELVRQRLADDMGYGDTSLVATAAGLASGIPEALIVTPFQVVKVRMQAKEHLGRYTGPLNCLTTTLRTEGPLALYTGIYPTLFRNCIWNSVYFGTMHWLKTLIPTPQSKVADTAQTLLTGFLGAVFATCFNAPFDVVKSRFQSQINVAPLKYTSTFQTLALIYKEEGITAMYKGFKPKAIRMGLGGAVAMATFEFVKDFSMFFSSPVSE